MILMAGGTGAVGRLAAQQLLTKGERVRIITRHAERQGALRDRGAEFVHGDLLNPDRLQPAFEGSTGLLISVHSFLNVWRSRPDQVDDRGVMRLIDLAREARVKQVVYVSVAKFTDDHAVDVFRIKAKVEKHLLESGMNYSILRPNCFMEVWADLIGKPMLERARTWIVGRGETQINFISVRDVAQMVVRAFQDPELKNKIVDLPGPENLTLNEVARRYGKAADQPCRIRHVPLWLFRLALLPALPFAPGFITRMRNIFTYLEKVEQMMAPSSNGRMAQLVHLHEIIEQTRQEMLK